MTTLSFSHDTFAKLSPHPYLLAHLPNSRANGRKAEQARQAHINNSSLTHANGSAVVRVGDTTVVCGIRGEISNDADGGGEDLLVPNVELATGCNPAFLPGNPPGVLAQSLSTRIYSLLQSSGVVDVEQLKIGEEGKAYWTLYIDVLFISLDGNPFDAAWAAVLSALRDVKLPLAYWDVDREMVLCVDDVEQARRLVVTGLPIACTFLVFRKGGEKAVVFADPDSFEEGLCDESVTVVVDSSRVVGSVMGLWKEGGTVVGKKEMLELVGLASKRWADWQVLLGG